MSTDAIYEKYMDALTALSGEFGDRMSADAISLALRLAIGDAYAAGLETCRGMADDLAAIVASQGTERQADQMVFQDALDQVDRLREERNALQQQLAQMDADNSGLLNRVQQAQQEIDRLTQQNTIAVDAFNSLHASTNGANPTPAAQSGDWGRNHPAWDGLSDEQRVTVYRLTTGDLRFRQVSQEDRVDLVRRVLRHLDGAVGKVTGPQFDRLRPAWMPTAGSVVLLSGSRKWNDLVTLVAMNAPA